MMHLRRYFLVFLLCFPCGLPGDEFPKTLTADPKEPVAAIRVDPVGGSDANDGRQLPVKTIARAIRLAQPGNTIHLAPARYYESADFTNKWGEPGRPIVLEGHGAVLDGSDPIDLTQWEALGSGLFKKVKLIPRMDDAILSRWFFLFGDKINRMGRCSKGPTLPLKAPSELADFEWTYIKNEDAFYIKVPVTLPLPEARIRYPLRSSGVVFSREGGHLTIQNITATHVYNDGFNIHGAQRNLKFVNIAAIECGDDGFSAHEDADCQIDGFISIGNATGLCDTGTSRTYYRNVFISECVGFDLYFIGAEHSLENALVESHAARAFWLDGFRLADGAICTLKMRNVHLRRNGSGPQEMRIGRGGHLDADRCTFDGMDVQVTPGGSVAMRRSIVQGDPKPQIFCWVNSLWRSDGNRYDVASFRVDRQSFGPAQFDQFRRLMGGEQDSIAAASSPEGHPPIGADLPSLQPLRPDLKKVLIPAP